MTTVALPLVEKRPGPPVLAHSLATIQIASPCHVAFSDMPGDEKKRFCGECKKNVYNLSAMSAGEAEALIHQHGTNLCATFYRRADGTVLTQDCPVGVRAKLRAAWARAIARVAAVAVLGLGFLHAGCKMRGGTGAAAAAGAGGVGSAIGLEAPPPPPPPPPPLPPPQPMPGGIRYMPAPAGGVAFCNLTPTPPVAPPPTVEQEADSQGPATEAAAEAAAE